MSLPKEPRQQMINMMYLVLIALLALSASAEILKAFRLIQINMHKSNVSALGKIKAIDTDFQLAYTNDPKKTEPFLKKSKKLEEYCNDLEELIITIQERLERAGSGDETVGDAAYQDHGHGIGELAEAKNTEIGSEVLILKGEGKKLGLKINETREKLKNEILDEKVREHFIFALSEAVDPPVQEGGYKPSWEEDKFEGMPLAAVVTMLEKLKGDLIATELDLLGYLLNEIGAEDMKFDKLETQVIPVSNYVTLGEEYNSQIFVSAYNSTQEPDIYIGKLDDSKITIDSFGNIDPIEIDPMVSVEDSLEVVNGKGLYTMSSNSLGLGPKTYEGVVKMRKPDGNFRYYPFRTNFMVGKSSVVVSPDKMNVLYIGVDNPLSVSVPGFGPDKVSASIPGATMRSKGGGKYIAKVRRPGKVNVNVSVKDEEGKSKVVGKAKFRVKRVPDPVPSVAGQSGGSIKTSTFKAQAGIIAELKDFDFDLRFRIVSFEMLYSKPRADLVSAKGTNERFTPKMKAMIKRAKPGDTFVFNDVKAKGPDGTTRKIGSISFILK